MKKGLLGSTALIGASALIAGTAGAAEAPTWKLTGNANFQFYYVDGDAGAITTGSTFTSNGTTWTFMSGPAFITAAAADTQDHDWYFGVDESELQLNVSGTADNGLNYGFKIELNANTTDGSAADEVRIQFKGGWGTLQMGDEDGAEDTMNYGGENLMGGPGGFDGDYDDVLFRATGSAFISNTGGISFSASVGSLAAPSFPTIAGDTSDHTKITYYSPRFSGFQVGASLTPTSGQDGDEFKVDSSFENHYGLGANYDNSFGGVRVRASAVYSGASSTSAGIEDISAWSVGGILGFGPVSVAANYTDNDDSGEIVGSQTTSSYWNVAASFETGPLYLAAGYMDSTREFGGRFGDSTFTMFSLTADYSVAPGLGVYAELDFVEDELLGGGGRLAPALVGSGVSFTNDTTIFIAGVNVSF
jgi:hypothetical protein